MPLMGKNEAIVTPTTTTIGIARKKAFFLIMEEGTVNKVMIEAAPALAQLAKDPVRVIVTANRQRMMTETIFPRYLRIEVVPTGRSWLSVLTSTLCANI